jgi:phosphatidylserine/phosphatidylglycerophosphate/cardiolipin synthase-like enzyme
VQAYFAGCQVADVLRELFIDRWSRSEGPTLQLPDCESPENLDYCPRGALPLGKPTVAFSRTDARGPEDTVREVEQLFVGAIAAAERLIYAETQYFSSHAVCDAFIARMRELERPRLQIVVILNDKPEAMKEELAVGLRQAKTLMRLAQAASETGHALGIYGTLSDGDAPDRPSTYIHSKLLIVDDRFLTVGSANLTNRSMGVDTELHASWEASAGSDADQQLIERIRALRVSLLAEHTGLAEATPGELDAAQLGDPEGLVARLDALSSRENARLTRHVLASHREKQIMKILDPEDLPFDPTEPDYGDAARALDEEQEQSRRSFVGGLTALWDKLKPS